MLTKNFSTLSGVSFNAREERHIHTEPGTLLLQSVLTNSLLAHIHVSLLGADVAPSLGSVKACQPVEKYSKVLAVDFLQYLTKKMTQSRRTSLKYLIGSFVASHRNILRRDFSGQELPLGRMKIEVLLEASFEDLFPDDRIYYLDKGYVLIRDITGIYIVKIADQTPEHLS